MKKQGSPKCTCHPTMLYGHAECQVHGVEGVMGQGSVKRRGMIRVKDPEKSVKVDPKGERTSDLLWKLILNLPQPELDEDSSPFDWNDLLKEKMAIVGEALVEDEGYLPALYELVVVAVAWIAALYKKEEAPK